MNKRLRKLTEYHSHTLRKSYYSTDIEKLSKELLEIAEKIKKLEGEKLITITKAIKRCESYTQQPETEKIPYRLLSQK